MRNGFHILRKGIYLLLWGDMNTCMHVHSYAKEELCEAALISAQLLLLYTICIQQEGQLCAQHCLNNLLQGRG